MRPPLNKGDDPNLKDEDGRTPLLHASSRGHVEVVQLLLARAADPDIQDAAQKPPLDRAAKNATELLMPKAAEPANAYKNKKVKVDIAQMSLRHHRAAERAETDW